MESIDGYTLAVDGRVDVEPLQSKLRFTLRTGLDSDLNWQNLHATLDTSKNVWEFQSIRTNQLLEVKYEARLANGTLDIVQGCTTRRRWWISLPAPRLAR